MKTLVNNEYNVVPQNLNEDCIRTFLGVTKNPN